jgi:tryptophan synthase alpha subunit
VITATDTGFTYALICNGVTVEAGHRDTEAQAVAALRQAEAFMSFEGESIEDQLERLGL